MSHYGADTCYRKQITVDEHCVLVGKNGDFENIRINNINCRHQCDHLSIECNIKGTGAYFDKIVTKKSDVCNLKVNKLECLEDCKYDENDFKNRYGDEKHYRKQITIDDKCVLIGEHADFENIRINKIKCRKHSEHLHIDCKIKGGDADFDKIE